MNKNKIKDLNSLNSYIEELENREVQIQAQLARNWEFLKSDFGGIMRSSVLHKINKEGRSSFIYWLFKIPEINNTLGRAAEKLIVKLENLLLKWFEKTVD
jgi:hypothetical protein